MYISRKYCIYTKSLTDNLIFEMNGTSRFLRPFSDVSSLIQRNSQGQCTQGLGISSTGSAIHTSPPGQDANVRVFITDAATGEKWFFRVNIITRNVSLECQSALDNVSQNYTGFTCSLWWSHECITFITPIGIF